MKKEIGSKVIKWLFVCKKDRWLARQCIERGYRVLEKETSKQRKNFGFSSGRNQIFLQIMNSVKKGKERLKISRGSLFRRRVQQLIEKVKYQVDKGVFKQLPLCIQETWGGLTSGKGGGWKLKIKGKWALEYISGGNVKWYSYSGKQFGSFL